jgi:hypothetical protein
MSFKVNGQLWYAEKIKSIQQLKKKKILIHSNTDESQ